MEPSITEMAKLIAIKLNAKTIRYNRDTETFLYYCAGETIHKFTKLDLTRFLNTVTLKK